MQILASVAVLAPFVVALVVSSAIFLKEVLKKNAARFPAVLLFI